MKEEKKESPIGVLWGWGKPYHGKFIGSIALAVLGVACQMVPYFCVAHIVTLMLSGDQNFSHYTAACVIALCGYLGKVIFSNLSTTISHTATYYTCLLYTSGKHQPGLIQRHRRGEQVKIGRHGEPVQDGARPIHIYPPFTCKQINWLAITN